MQKKAETPRQLAGTPKPFAGREVLADFMSEEATGRFSLKQIRTAAACAALDAELTGELVRDTLAALPRPRSR
jgi:hypothetical protein